MARFTRAWRMIATIAVGVTALLAIPKHATAVPGLQRVTSAESAYDNTPVKRVDANCPDGMVVLGGGAAVFQGGGRTVVRLTASAPVWRGDTPWDDVYDGWRAEAEAPGLSRGFTWSIVAYAICAPRWLLNDYEVRSISVTDNGSPDTFLRAEARCPSNAPVAYGSGADLAAVEGPPTRFIPTGELGLQMIRTSGPLDIARATARESEAGYAGQWFVRAYVICSDRKVRVPLPAGGTSYSDSEVHADGGASLDNEARDSCRPSFRTHGPGGGASGPGITDAGPSWLTRIYPFADLSGVQVRMTAPVDPAFGGMIAHHTCARF